MKLAVKFKDKDGNVHLDGVLNQNEISFLLQYAVNSLMAHGVTFALAKGEENSEEEIKFEIPEGTTVQ
jgi:hypothetical protein